MECDDLSSLLFTCSTSKWQVFRFVNAQKQESFDESKHSKEYLSVRIMTMQPKVLIIVGDASETLDTMYPYYRLIEAGFQPVVAAPEKQRYQMVKLLDEARKKSV